MGQISVTWLRRLVFFAIRDDREAINQEDMSKAVRKVAEAKKLEGKLEYQKL